MAEGPAAGWDLGGAHLKVARVGPQGDILAAHQIPCPLWQGMDRLVAALDEARSLIGPVRRHAVTMTGELVDLFESRAEGVARLIEAMVDGFPGAELRVYAGPAGFLTADAAIRHPREVASANWMASASLAAAACRQGLFLDIGSTTSDVVPFAEGRVLAEGYTDAERMIAEELVYTGVTRTPVMAVADSVPFAGRRQGLMAELFATMADVYRLIGCLPEGADQHPAADGRDKSPAASARRLSRMLGRDGAAADLADWRRLAAHLAERQRRRLQDACDRVLSRGLVAPDGPLVGAGIGRFLVRELAERMGRPYKDFADLVAGVPAAREAAARCAPAAAVAILGARAA